jgi:choline-sulfatase
MTTHNNNRTSRKGLTRRELLKHGVYSGLSAGLLSGLWLGGCGKMSRGSRPNVVVILIDTLRPDYLGFNGYRKETAKFLSALSKQSVVFERAFAPSSWTAPSTASLFTSKYPHRHGVVEGFIAHSRHVAQLRDKLRDKGKVEISLSRIPADIPTLPEIFWSMGYKTFGMATNINIGSEMGFDRGFDRFERIAPASADVVYMWVKWYEREMKDSEPYFLYLHPNDVHEPYNKHRAYYEEQDDEREDSRQRYISEIGYVDEYIGRIYETLRPVDNTIFVVVSDHGEEFWEHGGTGHTAKMYRELTQVLMLFHAPFLKYKPRRVTRNVSLIDVLPTLAEIVNREPLKDVDGISLVPLLNANASTRVLEDRLLNRILFSHRIEDAVSSPGKHWGKENPELQHWAAIYRNWNLIESWGDRRELYDHTVDVMEQKNVFSKHPELTSRLLVELQKFRKQGLRKDTEKTSTNLDENLLKNLRSLGYVE